MTGTRLHRQLVEENYQVGITVVRDYLRGRIGKRARVAERRWGIEDDLVGVQM